MATELGTAARAGGPATLVASVASSRGAARGSEPTLRWAVILLAVALAAAPLFSGYFDFRLWGLIALGAMVLLVAAACVARPAFTVQGVAACAALGVLLALSAASLLWAESKESAWTSVNRLGLYAVLFGIILLVVRDRRTGRVLMLVLGSAALMTALWLCATFLLGSGRDAFIERRLSSPIGYINGTAGLLVMGIWPWIAYSETASRRVVRAASLAGASAIAGTLVLTQSRAVGPAMIVTALLLLMCAPQRTRRGVNLIIVGASVAIGLPWTLAVYSTGGAAERLLEPGHALLRAAAAAILVAALGAGLVRVALTLLAERIGPERVGRTLRSVGRALAIASVMIVVVGAVAGAPWISREYRSFTALKVNPNASARFLDASGFRYDLWRVALDEFRAHPLDGVGAGNYDVGYYRLRHNPEYVVQPHSLELQMAAELGVGGLVAVLLLCGSILWGGFASGAGRLASGDRMIRLSALGIFSAWFVHTSVDWLYDIPGLTGMAMVAGALLVLPSGESRPDRPRSRRRLGVVAVGLVPIALLAASVGRRYVAERYARTGAALVARSPAVAIDKLRDAARLDPYSLAVIYSLASAYARLDDYGDARAALLLAAIREPHNYVPPALLGDLAMRRGYYGLAVSEYERALTLNPRDLAIRSALSSARSAAR